MKCKNCKKLKKLWWWTYKDNGKIDEKKYGHVCTELDRDGIYIKVDDLNGFCESFEQKEASGYWRAPEKGEGIGWVCTNCNYQVAVPSPFCPDCGARMCGNV